MSHEHLHRVIDAARRRRRQRDLLRGLSVGAAVGCGGALLAVLVDRFVQPGWSLGPVIAGLLVGSPLAGTVVSWFTRRPDPLGAAIELERHHHMKERLSSALFVERATPEDVPRELVELVLTDSETHAAQVDVRRAIPIERPRSASWAFGLGVATLLAAWLLPPLDLLGTEAARVEVDQEAKRLEEKDRRLRKRARELREIAERHPITPETKRLIADLEKPRTLPRTNDPKEAARRPLAELEDLKKRAEELKSRRDMKGLDGLVRSMQGIDERMETEEGRRARQAMSQGSPQRVSEALKDLAEKLAKNAASMSAAEQEAIARDLEKLAASLGGKFPELSKEMAEALSRMKAGDLSSAASQMGKNAEELARLAKLLREKNLLDAISQEIEFTQDELAQLPTEWKEGPPPKICPDCLKGT